MHILVVEEQARRRSSCSRSEGLAGQHDRVEAGGLALCKSLCGCVDRCDVGEFLSVVVVVSVV